MSGTNSRSMMRWLRLGGGIGWGRLCGECGPVGAAEVCGSDAELLLWLNVEGEGLIWGRTVAFCGLMGVWEKDLCAALAATAGEGVSEGLMAEARILEWAANRLVQGRVDPADLRPREGPVGVALAHLRGHFIEPLDLDGLARTAGVSAPHLCRLVKLSTGLTLQRHLRRLRVAHACELLASGRSNVTEAALDCGYQSLSHFAKAFREETGENPSDWLATRRRTGK